MTVHELIGGRTRSAVDGDVLTRCVVECFRCADTCTSCAEACVEEENVHELLHCMRLELDCADVCDAARRVVARQTATNPDVLRAVVQACATACRACAEECERHADRHAHCGLCADACRRCAEACESVSAALAPLERSR